MRKPQTAREILEAILQNVQLDARIAESTAFDCEQRLKAYAEGQRLRRAAGQLRAVAAELAR